MNSQQRISLIIISLLFLFLIFKEFETRDVPTYKEIIGHLQNATTDLSNLTFSPFNDSNSLSYNDIQSILQNQSFVDIPNPVYYQNITGSFKGVWNSKNFTTGLHLYNDTELANNRGDFPNSQQGIVSFSLESKNFSSPEVNYVQGHFRVFDIDRDGKGVLVYTRGVYFKANGTLLLYGFTDQGVFNLRNITDMMPTIDTFQLAQQLLQEKMQQRIEQLQELEKEGVPVAVGGAGDETDFSMCAFQTYIQLDPMPEGSTLPEVEELENELINPTGITTIPLMPLTGRGILYSKNCHLLLEINTASGLKVENFYLKAITYFFVTDILAIIQILVTARQIKYTTTPSMVSRVSVWSIGMQSYLDAYYGIIHLTVGFLFEKLFVPAATCSFFFLICCCLYGLKYVHQIQSLQPVSNPIANRNFMLGVSALFTLYWLTNSNILLGILTIIMFSFWVPQIYLNALKNSRKSLTLEYAIVISLCRMFLPAYAYLCPNGLLSDPEELDMLNHHSWRMKLILGYVAIQVGILSLQKLFGPRWFIPGVFLHPVHNYHTLIEDDVEAGINNQTRRPKDCAICLSHVSTSNPNEFMCTPCQHIFHVDCLSQWMDMKMECPVCRAELPNI